MEHHPFIEESFPRSLALGLEFVQTRGSDTFHLAFDSENVKEKLGHDKFAKLMAGVKEVVSCDHRSHPDDHSDKNLQGVEVHCIWAKDLEDFLGKAGE